MGRKKKKPRKGKMEGAAENATSLTEVMKTPQHRSLDRNQLQQLHDDAANKAKVHLREQLAKNKKKKAETANKPDTQGKWVGKNPSARKLDKNATVKNLRCNICLAGVKNIYRIPGDTSGCIRKIHSRSPRCLVSNHILKRRRTGKRKVDLTHKPGARVKGWFKFRGRMVKIVEKETKEGQLTRQTTRQAKREAAHRQEKYSRKAQQHGLNSQRRRYNADKAAKDLFLGGSHHYSDKRKMVAGMEAARQKMQARMQSAAGQLFFSALQSNRGPTANSEQLEMNGNVRREDAETLEENGAAAARQVARRPIVLWDFVKVIYE